MAMKTKASSFSVWKHAWVVLIASSALGQVVPSSRLATWQGNVGIPGGIPNRTTIFQTIAAGASQSTIQSALNSCPSNQVVLLSAGSYTLSGTLTVPTGVTLRGAGMGTTVLNAGSGTAVLLGTASYGVNTANSIAVTGTIAAQSTSLTLNSASGVTVGSYLMLTELNDSSIPVTIAGDSGSCTWCDGWSGTRSAGQIVEVTSVNGTVIGFTPGAYMAYTLTPLASPFTAAGKWAGVENLTVYAVSGTTVNFMMGNAAYCWLKNVEGNFTGGDHVEIIDSYRCEVRHSFFHDAFIHGPGTYDETLSLDWKTSGCLVEDNIFWRLHTSVIINRGSSGNVLAYNFSTNMYTSGSPTFMPIDFDSCHGAHTMYNLEEGNVVANLISDSIWGSSSDTTLFRNYSAGENWSQSPEDARYGSSTSTPLPAPVGLLSTEGRQTQAENCIWIGDLAHYFNIVGNVLGDGYVKSTSTTVYEATGAVDLYDGIPYELILGANTSGANGGTGTSSTAIVEGNYDVKNAQQMWSAGALTLPTSYYLTAKPAYFGTCPWPPVDPSNPSAFSPTNIPAGYRFFYGVDPSSSISTNQPPIAKATGTPTSGSAPLAVTFSSSGSSDPSGLSLSYSWNFGDGTTSTSANPSHTFQAGTYSVILTVSDGVNTVQATPVTISVSGVTSTNLPPIAASSASPTSGTIPLTVTFSSTGSSDPQGNALTYSWNFGDGTTSTTANPVHTYTAAGTFSAQLTVSDGTSSTSASILTITTTVPVSTGPVAAYGFEEGSGSTVTDSSGNGNSGIISSATWTNGGKYGYALVFNGSNAIITINNSASLNLNSALTLEAWVNPSALGSWKNLLYKPQGSTGLSYVLQGSSSTTKVPSLALSMCSSNLMAPSPLTVGTWSHVAATYDGTTMTFYVNGSPVASRPQTGAIVTSTNALTIGGNAFASEYWNGIIDEVRIYNRALSATEITNDMATAIIPRPPAPNGLRVIAVQ